MTRIACPLLIAAALMGAIPAFAIDGNVLINQATVMHAGGFPYKITLPGSYKLSGSLVVPAETNGIEIVAPGVSLDLNGFSITGPIVCDSVGANCSLVPTALTRGIFAQAASIVVRNGFVSGFTRGVANAQLIEEMVAFSNSSFGIVTNGAVVRRNVASANGGAGIFCIDCTVTENVANHNGRTFSPGTGLFLQGGVFGSNTLDGNLFGGLDIAGPAVSQHNNSCDGAAC
jgi:hypothetical protein